MMRRTSTMPMDFCGSVFFFFVISVLTWTAATSDTVDISPGYFIESQPRLSIRSGKAITRNSSRRIANLTAVSNYPTTPAFIRITWNMTPPVTEACCTFTLLGVYRTDLTDHPSWSPEHAADIILLQANVSEYVLNVNELRYARRNLFRRDADRNPDHPTNRSDDQAKYGVCVQIWLRNRGTERKLDESCVSVTVTVAEKWPWNFSRNVVVIFIVVIVVNLLLIIGLICIHLRKGKNGLPFAVKAWWKDVSDVLQNGGGAAHTEVLEETVHGVAKPALSVVSTGPLNNAMYVQNVAGRYHYPVSLNGHLMRTAANENVYCGVDDNYQGDQLFRCQYPNCNRRFMTALDHQAHLHDHGRPISYHHIAFDGRYHYPGSIHSYAGLTPSPTPDHSYVTGASSSGSDQGSPEIMASQSHTVTEQPMLLQSSLPPQLRHIPPTQLLSWYPGSRATEDHSHLSAPPAYPGPYYCYTNDGNWNVMRGHQRI